MAPARRSVRLLPALQTRSQARENGPVNYAIAKPKRKSNRRVSQRSRRKTIERVNNEISTISEVAQEPYQQSESNLDLQDPSSETRHPEDTSHMDQSGEHAQKPPDVSSDTPRPLHDLRPGHIHEPLPRSPSSVSTTAEPSGDSRSSRERSPLPEQSPSTKSTPEPMHDSLSNLVYGPTPEGSYFALGALGSSGDSDSNPQHHSPPQRSGHVSTTLKTARRSLSETPENDANERSHSAGASIVSNPTRPVTTAGKTVQIQPEWERPRFETTNHVRFLSQSLGNRQLRQTALEVEFDSQEKLGDALRPLVKSVYAPPSYLAAFADNERIYNDIVVHMSRLGSEIKSLKAQISEAKDIELLGPGDVAIDWEKSGRIRRIFEGLMDEGLEGLARWDNDRLADLEGIVTADNHQGAGADGDGSQR